jgi:hypothetical protein
MIDMRAYEEVIDFIAAGATPEEIATFRPSEAMKQRVEELVRREKTVGLTAEETSELNYCLLLEHLMRLAKARARRHFPAERQSDRLCLTPNSEEAHDTPLPGYNSE